MGAAAAAAACDFTTLATHKGSISFTRLVARLNNRRAAVALKWSFMQKHKTLQKSQQESKGVRKLSAIARWETAWSAMKIYRRWTGLSWAVAWVGVGSLCSPVFTPLPSCVTQSNMIYFFLLYLCIHVLSDMHSGAAEPHLSILKTKKLIIKYNKFWYLSADLYYKHLSVLWAG